MIVITFDSAAEQLCDLGKSLFLPKLPFFSPCERSGVGSITCKDPCGFYNLMTFLDPFWVVADPKDTPGI